MQKLFATLALVSLAGFVGCNKDAGTEPVVANPGPEGGSMVAPAAPDQPAEPMNETPPPAGEPAPEGA